MAGILLLFEDGPAKKAPGMIAQRAPLFLRVVHLEGREERGMEGWDALDQLEDEPEADEAIYVYERQAGVGHVRGHGKNFSGPMCFYRHRADVDGEKVRNRVDWRTIAEGLKPTTPAIGDVEEVRA